MTTAFFSYKKVGGLHFIRLGSLGFSFFMSKKRKKLVDTLAKLPYN
jgi:hypothetical protein